MKGRLVVAFILSFMKTGHLVKWVQTQTYTHLQMHSVMTNEASWLSLKKDRRLTEHADMKWPAVLVHTAAQSSFSVCGTGGIFECWDRDVCSSPLRF